MGRTLISSNLSNIPMFKLFCKRKVGGGGTPAALFFLSYFHQNHELESSLGAAWRSNKHITFSFAQLRLGSGREKKKKILPVGSGGGDTVKHDASIFVRVFSGGGRGGGAPSRQAPGFGKMSCDW